MPADTRDASVEELISAVDTRLKQVHTRSLDLSFNELLDMHATGELNISPDYQRLFQWSEGARSRFIESLLLQMPVPPIYVVEEEDGKYLLIDGLQRISSYLHLRGQLEAKHLDPPIELGAKLVLSECDIVTELNGKTFDELGTALQIRLKRAFVRVEVIRKGSDPKFKYYMFKRLNTGGELLSEQQIRNCTIRLLDSRFNDFIIHLSEVESFRKCTESLTGQRRLEAFDQELVLRFFAMKNNRDNFRHDVADFLTKYMESMSDPTAPDVFNYPEEEAIFLKTFKVLERTLGEEAFSFANKARTKLTGGFSVYHYEALAIGIQKCIDRIDPDKPEELEKLASTLRAIKLDEEFIRITTGGGKNSPGPLNDRIRFVQDRVCR